MKDVLNSIKWPGALVILGCLGLIAFLYWRGAGLEALVAAGVALLGYQTTQRVQDSQRLSTIEGQTNGVNEGLRRQLAAINAERQQDARIMAALASRVPMGTPLPPALEQAGMMTPTEIPAELIPAGYTNGSMTVPLPRVGDPEH
jgi:hypothetical protein